MYQKFNSYNRGRNSSSRFSGRSNRPSRRNRETSSFNPSQIVSNGVVEKATEEFIPVTSFASLPISDTLKKNITYKKYVSPTPIQDQVITHILNGRDVIGIANTGTGKTAAFLIPLIDKVLKNPNTKILIVAPARELAVQIENELHEFAYGLGIYAALCIGGTKAYRQQNELRRKYNFVIGTPGRLKDLIQNKSLDLGTFNTVVLDEVDHMVDIGFIHDITYLISLLPKVRQSLFFSATVDGKVKDILRAFVTDSITISVKTQDTIENIKQDIIKVTNKNLKVDQLHDLLIQKEYEKVLIFGRTKWGVQRLSDELVKRGFKADAIHGNKRQSQRQRALDQFKRNAIQILLATDVAARGLDIDDVSHVINYDLPSTYEDYIHRIGRTGRANKRGIALTFVE